MADPRLEGDIKPDFFSDKYSLLDAASDTVTYYGFPVLDADGTDPLCAIAKQETTGNVTTLKWVDGDMIKNKLWSLRASQSYEYLKSS